MLEHGISGNIIRSEYDDTYVIAGSDEFSGRYWENFYETAYHPIEVGNGGGGSNSNSSFGRGEPSVLNASSGALAMGELARQAKTYEFFGKTTQQVEDALANGKYVHKNGKVYNQKFRGNQYISSKSVKK